MSIVRSTTALWRATDDYLAVGGIDGSVFEFGGSATLVWDLLTEAISFDDLVQHLSVITGADPEEVRSGANGLIDRLEELGHIDRLP